MAEISRNLLFSVHGLYYAYRLMCWVCMGSRNVLIWTEGKAKLNKPLLGSDEQYRTHFKNKQTFSSCPICPFKDRGPLLEDTLVKKTNENETYTLSSVTGSGHVKYMASPFFTFIWSLAWFYNSWNAMYKWHDDWPCKYMPNDRNMWSSFIVHNRLHIINTWPLDIQICSCEYKK